MSKHKSYQAYLYSFVSSGLKKQLDHLFLEVLGEHKRVAQSTFALL